MTRTLYSIVILGISLTISLAILGGVLTQRKIEAHTRSFNIYSEEIKKSTSRIVSDSENILVERPLRNEAVSMPFTVEGFARVFENVVNIRLVDSEGLVLARTWTEATPEDIGQRGSFRKRLFFIMPISKKGTLEVFSISAKDGAEVDKVEVPLRFRSN